MSIRSIVALVSLSTMFAVRPGLAAPYQVRSGVVARGTAVARTVNYGAGQSANLGFAAIVPAASGKGIMITQICIANGTPSQEIELL